MNRADYSRKIIKYLAKALFFTGTFHCITRLIKWEEESKNDIYNAKEKFRIYYQLTLRWLNNDADGKKVKQYLHNKNISRIAVYGNGDFGNILRNQLQKDDTVEIVCFIDRSRGRRNQSSGQIPVIDIGEVGDWKDMIDAIIVTPILEFEAIKKDIEKNINTEIISLQSIIYESSLGGVSC